MRGSEELAQLLQSERLHPGATAAAIGSRSGPSLASSFFGGRQHHKLGPPQHDAKAAKDARSKPKSKAASSALHSPPSSALVTSRSLQWAAVEAASHWSEGGPLSKPKQLPLEERGTPHALLADVATLLAAAPRPPTGEEGGEHQVGSAAEGTRLAARRAREAYAHGAALHTVEEAMKADAAADCLSDLSVTRLQPEPQTQT